MTGERIKERERGERMEGGAKVDRVRVNNFALERLEDCGKRGWKMFFYFLILMIICIFISTYDSCKRNFMIICNDNLNFASSITIRNKYSLELFLFVNHK